VSTAAMLFLALALDALAGEPGWLWSRAPHPAVVMGRAVAWLERQLNRGARRKARGCLALGLLGGGALAFGLIVQALPGGGVIGVVGGAVLLAQRSLVDHLRAVSDGLRLSLRAGRRAVALVVGRDTQELSREGVARAAIESGAENFSDGVIAPAFWFLLFGLPGMLVYKAVNTADSMIGYRTPRHESFGWAAARLDDALNWVPARLSAALIALAHLRPDAWAVIRRDAPLHRSPNAGWPEAAMAVCLGVSLAGPRSYEGRRRDFPWVFAEGRRSAGADDIDRCIGALWRGWTLSLAATAILALV